MPSLADTRAYDKLIVALHAALAQGLEAARKSLEYQRLKTYWTVGKKLQSYLDVYPGSASGREFYQQLSQDIAKRSGSDITYDTLRRAVQFAREYPRFPKSTPLTFTHYLALLRVSDPRQRARLESRAIKHTLTVTQVKDEISLLSGPSGPDLPFKARTLSVERGEPFIYYVQAGTDLAGKRMLRIDCGFKIQKSIPDGNTRIKTGNRIVRVTKTADSYSLSMCQKLRAKRYTYAAVVTRIIDGDTFDAQVDVGFGIWINDRFRLRGINTPELSSPGGQRARVFLERFLLKCPRIIICSTKEGVYGRWLADVFALQGESAPHLLAREGQYLNQILLDEGMAEIYR